MKRRLTAIVCAAMMLGSSLPVTAFAQTYEDRFRALSTDTELASESGELPWNLTWRLDEDTKTVTVSGEGAMKDFRYVGEVTIGSYSAELMEDNILPFNGYPVKTLIAEEGVTTIGAEMFSPDFGAGSVLTTVILPDTVTSIGKEAFADTALETLELPESVTSFGEDAFAGTPWLEARKAESTMVIVNNILIDGTQCEGDVVIPDGVTGIADGAFADCTGLTSVTIPEGVVSIGKRAFAGCTGLPEVTIPGSVTHIGGNAFRDTPWLSARQAEDPLVIVNSILIDGMKAEGDLIIPDGVTCIGECAFGSRDIEYEHVWDEEPPKGVFSNAALTSVVIPDGVTQIEDEAFWECNALTSVTFPDTLISIGKYAFGCTSVFTPRLPEHLRDIGFGAFSASKCIRVTIPESVEYIGPGAFTECYYYNEETTERTDLQVTVLSKDCEIGIRALSGFQHDTTIYGYPGSTVEAYANEYQETFISLDTPSAVGDVNLDGKVDSSDAADLLIALARMGAGEDSGMNDAQLAVADVDGNGTLNAADATVILQYAAYIGAGGALGLEEFLTGTGTPESPTEPPTESPTEPPTESPTEPSANQPAFYASELMKMSSGEIRSKCASTVSLYEGEGNCLQLTSDALPGISVMFEYSEDMNISDRAMPFGVRVTDGYAEPHLRAGIGYCEFREAAGTPSGAYTNEMDGGVVLEYDYDAYTYYVYPEGCYDLPDLFDQPYNLTYTDEVESYLQSHDPVITEIWVHERQEDPAPETPKNDPWRDAYKDIVVSRSANYDGNAAYSLYDLDNDGIPELFFSRGSSRTDGVEVYSYGKTALSGFQVYSPYQMCMEFFGDTSVYFGEYGKVCVSNTNGKVYYGFQNSSTGETSLVSFVMKENRFKCLFEYYYDGSSGIFYNGVAEATQAQFDAGINEYNEFIDQGVWVGRDCDASDMSLIETW